MTLPPFITQPEYEEQRYNLAIQAGVAPPRQWNPDLSIQGRTIDPRNLQKNLTAAYDPAFDPNMGFDFDQDGSFTNGETPLAADVFGGHVDAFFEELGISEADRLAERPTGFVTELDEGEASGMMQAHGENASLANLDSNLPFKPANEDPDAFMRDLLHDFPTEDNIDDDQPLVQAYEDWSYKPQSADMYRMIGMLNTAADEMRSTDIVGMDVSSTMPSVELFARSMASTANRTTMPEQETGLEN